MRGTLAPTCRTPRRSPSTSGEAGAWSPAPCRRATRPRRASRSRATSSCSGTTASTTGCNVASISGSSPIAITPSNLQFATGTATPTISQANTTLATGALMLIQPQQSTNGNAQEGNLVLKMQPPSGAGGEAFVQVQRGALNEVQLGNYPGNSGLGAVWLGQVTPGDPNPVIIGDGANSTYLNVTNAGGSVFVSFGATSSVTSPANPDQLLHRGVHPGRVAGHCERASGKHHHHPVRLPNAEREPGNPVHLRGPVLGARGHPLGAGTVRGLQHAERVAPLRGRACSWTSRAPSPRSARHRRCGTSGALGRACSSAAPTSWFGGKRSKRPPATGRVALSRTWSEPAVTQFVLPSPRLMRDQLKKSFLN